MTTRKEKEEIMARYYKKLNDSIYNTNCKWEYNDSFKSDYFNKNLDEINYPDSIVDSEFVPALEMIFSGRDSKSIRNCFKKTIKLARMLKVEDIYTKSIDFIGSGFPKSEGRALRTEAYAKAMLYGELDTKMLRKAAYLYLNYYNQEPTYEFDSGCEYDALTAVMIMIIVGDKLEAQQVLYGMRRCIYFKRLYSILKIILDKNINKQKRTHTLRVLLKRICRPYYRQQNRAMTEYAFYPFQIAWIYLQLMKPEIHVFTIQEIANVVKRNV